MKYFDFKDKKLSALGLGAMRLPTLEDGSIDMALTEQMIDKAVDSGINYFDTAYPYHGGMSEIVVSKFLKKYPRDSYYLATKYPGHQVLPDYDPAVIFEEQLKKCEVDYFDFYLLHNVAESSLPIYLNEEYGIIDYFMEQKRKGRIKHLGFSSHASPDTLKSFLDLHGDKMEFCLIQLNYLDWSLQRADEKCRILKEHNIPVWVMEPVRGGRLVNKLPESATEHLTALRPDESVASWCFRWLMTLDNMGVILSGMSNMEQLLDNIKTFTNDKPLSEEEIQVLYDIAESLKSSVPCTACRYCVSTCPMGLDIPLLIEIYNDMRYAPGVNSGMKIEFMPEDKRPTACICCGSCIKTCPQNIDIPRVMIDLSNIMKTVPSWRRISAERAEEARRLAESSGK